MRYMVGHINGFVSREIYSMFVTPLGGHGLTHLAKVHVYTKSVIDVSIRPRTHARTHTCLFISYLCIMCMHTDALVLLRVNDGLSKRPQPQSQDAF